MNIVLMCSVYLPNLGGVEIAVSHLASELSAKGHQVSVITARPFLSHLKAHETINGVQVYRTPFSAFGTRFRSSIAFPFRFPGSLLRMIRIVRSHRADVINLHFVDSGGFYALCLKGLLRIPLVVTLHGEDLQLFPKQAAAYRWILSRALRQAAFVTGCSSNLLEEASQNHPEIIGKSVPILNGIELSELAGHEAYASDGPYLFAVGRLVYKKGFDVLIEAFRLVLQSFPHLMLVLAGDGPERSNLESKIQALGLNDRIKLLGQVERAQVGGLFSGCQFFVLPSRREPFGIVNLEAMAFGKAIVATRVGGVPEILTEGENALLVPPDDAAAMATAMTTLLQNTGLRTAMETANQRKVLDFTWDKVCQQYLSVYQQAIG
jgi:glycogen(starch) synthase